MKSGHIDVQRGTDGVDVIADDLEVFDYLDDLLTDCGLEFEFIREEEREGRRFYVMHFGSNVAEERIVKALDAVSTEEVERLWKLNN